MPSPITSTDICATKVTGTANLCSRFKALLSLPNLLCDWFTYAFTSSGGISEAFKADFDAAGIGTPVGAIFFWLSPSLPTNYQICNGQPISRTEFPELFSKFGTQFGAGDNVNTFNLPNMQGRFALGAGQRAAANPYYVFQTTGGEDEVSLTGAQTGPHSHGIKTRKIDNVELFGSTVIRVEAFEGYNNGTDTSFFAPPTTVNKNTEDAGSGAPHSNIPPMIVGFWIVRAK